MINITHLDVEANQLKELPPEIGNLKLLLPGALWGGPASPSDPDNDRTAFTFKSQPVNARKNYEALLDRVFGELNDGHSHLEKLDDTQLLSSIEHIYEVVSNVRFNERGGLVLVLRYGLSDGHRRSQAEVGRNLKLSGARVGQIERKTIMALRHPNASRRLLEAMDPH